MSHATKQAMTHVPNRALKSTRSAQPLGHRRALGPLLQLRQGIKSSRGLTLVEMLVAMVILGFMLALVSQAVQQVSQLVRAAEAATRTITGGWAGAWALQPTLSNLVWPLEKQADGFKGTPTRIEGFSNAPLSGTSVGVQPFVLELRRGSSDPPQTEVWGTSEGLRPGATSTQLVARLDGAVAFAYANATGARSPVWPALTSQSGEADPIGLPHAVVLQAPDGQNTSMWFAFEGEKLRPKPPSKAFFE
jgi:prepilin-type N-terminal cleavage/methylation domain-containing protein